MSGLTVLTLNQMQEKRVTAGAPFRIPRREMIAVPATTT